MFCYLEFLNGDYTTDEYAVVENLACGITCDLCEVGGE